MKDGGTHLKNLISKSVNATPIWEIPKGRKNSYRERDINCAIREFYEETGICNSKYKIYTDKQNIMSYNDEGKRYTNVYYTALIQNHVNVGVNNALKEQLREIVDCRWMNIDAIRFIDHNKRIEKFVKHIFNFVKQKAAI
jgi:8-oxo-dGTP pyrophosphatase MutT (NUDIX family)